MKVETVVVCLRGKYDLTKLEKLGYRKHLDSWYFDGKMHRYLFEPINEDSVEILIKKRPGFKGNLVHQVTFGNFHDWVRKSVDAIQIGPDR